MKKLLFQLVLLISLAMFTSCKDCDMNLDECKNGGILNEDECKCECQPGYGGSDCTLATNLKKLHADISYDGTASYSYDPPTLDVKVLDHPLTDTLWIDGYDHVSGSYCFMRLYLNDLTTIKVGDEYPVEGSSRLGSCWAAFLDPAKDPSAYTAQGTSNGKLKITSYQPGNKIAGTFDFIVRSGTSEVHAIGWFEGR